MRWLLLATTASCALMVASCSSESVNETAAPSGGTGGVDGGGASGGSAGTASGGTAGTVTGGTAGAATGGSSGDAGVDAATNPCAFQDDAGVIGKWPDSKTQWCTGGSCVGAGQDGDYEIHPPTYQVSGSVVKDSITGLEWRKDVSAATTWANAGGACAALNGADAGAGPWRLPTKLELTSLLDFGASGALLQPGELDAPTGPANFWVSAEFLGNPSLAWGVSFLVGSVGSNPKSTALSVRCVRGTPPTPKLVANTSCNVVSDVGLGLMWYRTSESAQYAWPAALAHCQGLTHAGFDDWRLPNAKELMTIVADSAVQPAIDTAAFGATPSEFFWSSTPNRSDLTKAQAVDFATGVEAAYDVKSAYRARCVRSLP